MTRCSKMLPASNVAGRFGHGPGAAVAASVEDGGADANGVASAESSLRGLSMSRVTSRPWRRARTSCRALAISACRPGSTASSPARIWAASSTLNSARRSSAAALTRSPSLASRSPLVLATAAGFSGNPSEIGCRHPSTALAMSSTRQPRSVMSPPRCRRSSERSNLRLHKFRCSSLTMPRSPPISSSAAAAVLTDIRCSSTMS
mmetsp:Transcript_5359/g.15171  ORF Transcript_5359/g.15171 Transcript_5359/m.15171 type:complete len:204 (-) Transcript_5359:1221-1832(-)